MPSCGPCQGTLRPETRRGNAAKQRHEKQVQICRSWQRSIARSFIDFMLPIFDMWTEWHWIVLSQVARMATLLGEKVETGVFASSQAWSVQNFTFLQAETQGVSRFFGPSHGYNSYNSQDGGTSHGNHMASPVMDQLGTTELLLLWDARPL